MKSRRVEITPRTLAYVLLAAAVVWGAFVLANVLIVVIVALMLVGTIDPLIAWLERRGYGRGRALIAVFFLLTFVIGALLLLMVPAVVSQVLQLTTEAPKARDKLVAWLAAYEAGSSIAASVKALPVDDLMSQAGRVVLGYSTTIITTIGYAVTTMFLAIYLLADPVRSKGMLYAVIPRAHHIKLARILLELKVIVGGYMRGQMITSAAITLFVFALLTIMGVEHALALALFAGFTDVIPFVGGLIASAPVVVAVAPSGVGAMVVVGAIMLVYQELESRILVPRVYGGVLRLSPAIVIIALLVGLTLMGILGALIALPIAAGLRMLVRELRVELPGEEPADGTVRANDAKEEQIYGELTVGATAADAGVIAGELAEKHKAEEREDTVLAIESMGDPAHSGERTVTNRIDVGEVFAHVTEDARRRISK